MSTGFSLKITKKPKKGSKLNKKVDTRKKKSVFGEEVKSETRTKIKLTHVDQHTEEKPNELVIKPEVLRSSLWEPPAGPEEQQVEYGLTYNQSNFKQEPQDESMVTKNVLRSSSLRWLEQLPEETQEEEYEQVPVEEFGEALLRGMGWDGVNDDMDENNRKGTKILHEVGRELYSGIGAKGASVGQNPKKFAENSFMPLVKVHRETGERVDTTERKT